MKKQLLLTLIFVVAVATPALAQLASPNAAGVAAGHIHLNANDVDVQKKFWTDVGGTIVNREKLVMVQFPGIYVLLRKQDYNGGSVGFVINHFGVFVKDFDKDVARGEGAGLNWGPGNNTGQGDLKGPERARIRVYENKSIPTPMAMHHIHLWVPDTIAAQKWYVQNFGATAGKRAQFDTANVPGTEITFNKVDKAQSPTKG